MSAPRRRVDFETHFFTQDYVDLLRARDEPPMQRADGERRELWFEPTVPEVSLKHPAGLEESLLEIGARRAKAMEQAGVGLHVLSLTAPGTEQLPVEVGAGLARKVNDTLAAAARAFPDHFRGFAALAPGNPEEAARELERCVTSLGFIGANIHSHIGGESPYLDDPRYRPIFATAARLGVPIYIHPTVPHASMAAPYLGYGFTLAAAGLGFGAETCVHAVRLILSGLFDEYPSLRIGLGHFGEGLPFWAGRLDGSVAFMAAASGEASELGRLPGEYLRDNFFFTCSGHYSEAPFLATQAAVGIDNILLGSDFPYVPMQVAVAFVDQLPISPVDRDKIAFGNAERLFGL